MTDKIRTMAEDLKIIQTRYEGLEQRLAMASDEIDRLRTRNAELEKKDEQTSPTVYVFCGVVIAGLIYGVGALAAYTGLCQ